MIILVTGNFDIYDEYGKTGQKEFVVSHGIDEETGKNFVLPNEHPLKLGARFDTKRFAWIIDD